MITNSEPCPCLGYSRDRTQPTVFTCACGHIVEYHQSNGKCDAIVKLLDPQSKMNNGVSDHS